MNDDDTVAVWRIESAQSQDQSYGNNGPNNAWRDVYGIHAALLPTTSMTSSLKHGWVILWGYGHQRHVDEQNRLNAPTADDKYPSSYFVSRVGMSPFLFWHPKDTNTTNNARRYGYVRYLFDDDGWNATYGDWPIYKMFCAGHAFLPDGRLYLAGGDGDLYDSSNIVKGYVGLRLKAILDPWTFDPFNTNQSQSLWSANNAMIEPRWYPTVTALPSGKLLILGGTHYKIHSDSAIVSEKHEIYDPCTDSLDSTGVPSNFQSVLGFLYPRLHLVSYMNSAGNGLDTPRVVYTGFDKKSYWLNALQPDSDWQYYGNDLQRSLHRTWGSSVLLPNSKDNPQSLSQQVLNQVMVVGGDHGTITTNVTETTEIMTFSASSSGGTVTIAAGSSMANKRMHVNTVLLPTGDVLAIGGIKKRASVWEYKNDVNETDEVYATEQYTKNPSTGQYYWKNVAPAPTIDRNSDGIRDGIRVYHSIALLLPNGKVLTAGSATKDNSAPQRTINNRVPTIYSPPYLFKPNGACRSETERPHITAVSATELNYGQEFVVSFDPQNDKAIVSVVLARPGSVTHSFNFEQRLIKLKFDHELDYLKVTSPWDPSIAPPGWYMLFLLDAEGVPSEAAWVKIKPPNCEGEAAMFMSLELGDVATEVSAEQADQVEQSPIRIEFQEPGSGEVIERYTLPMFAPDAEGRVSLPIYTDRQEMEYELYIHPYRSWLGKRLSVNWSRGGQIILSLRNGDVNGDNLVDALDLALALEQMGASDSASETVWSADVNLDGVVDENDLAIIAENLGSEGDQ
ncbi:MAG: DUF1929 domain-containing protein [Fimbriimonadia bacterium]|nr:DUF1929 domain-containing protein [Fimbriimonadia bacterium]